MYTEVVTSEIRPEDEKYVTVPPVRLRRVVYPDDPERQSFFSSFLPFVDILRSVKTHYYLLRMCFKFRAMTVKSSEKIETKVHKVHRTKAYMCDNIFLDIFFPS